MKITDISHFTISKHKLRRRSLRFSMYDVFFENEITYKIFYDRIEFYKPSIDSRKIIHPNKNHGAFHFHISEDLDINVGSYNLEEIENEDVRVFIFPDNYKHN